RRQRCAYPQRLAQRGCGGWRLGCRLGNHAGKRARTIRRQLRPVEPKVPWVASDIWRRRRYSYLALGAL
ncbi:hypothetical protein IWW57_001180, partial [Coemansia sp. S610]